MDFRSAGLSALIICRELLVSRTADVFFFQFGCQAYQSCYHVMFSIAEKSLASMRKFLQHKRYEQASHWDPSKLTHSNRYFDEDSSCYSCQDTRVGMCQFTRIPMPKSGIFFGGIFPSGFFPSG